MVSHRSRCAPWLRVATPPAPRMSSRRCDRVCSRRSDIVARHDGYLADEFEFLSA